ncbi:polysaccharide deacetylase family protein [Chitinophaga sp. SYP-B3965]|uniref:polysaccharide deacetylase family protein n=1 Tax=Chitinophaga sp. SYP-B3965 TaxID=2663120 RepID=UPI001299C95D|nr:polysaccharide deacetylase family protein [Chitinophaga sp. SYP-B3965]MRG46041.1 polysaccharide deacetylase family protein [Chitinophaga sp. SYP-B3965]
MLKYRVIWSVCWVAIIVLVFMKKLWLPATPIWPVFLILGVSIAFLIWGSTQVNSNFYFEVKCKAQTQEKIVALSFDDGPMENYTPQILEILQQHNVPAAFFCIGHRVEKAPGLLKQIHEEGHLIGNHTYSHHALFDLYPAKKMENDLDMADQAITDATGLKPRLFRPPYGVTNPMLERALSHGKYISVGWSIRSMDTVIKDEAKLLAKVTKDVQPGDIFLFHDTCAITVKILPALIKEMKERGFAFKRIDELLNVPAYA